MRRAVAALIFLLVVLSAVYTPVSAFGDDIWQGTLPEVTLNLNPNNFTEDSILYAAGEDFFVIGFNDRILVYSLKGTLLWNKTFEPATMVSYVGVRGETIAATVESYSGDKAGYLYLFNATSGFTIWRRKVSDAGIISMVSARYFSDMIVVSVTYPLIVNGSRGYLLAYDLQGNKLWTFNVPAGGFSHQSTAEVKERGDRIFLAENYASTLLFPDMELENHSSTVFILDKGSGALLNKVEFKGWYVRGMDTSENLVLVALYTLKNESGLKEVSELVGLSLDGKVLWRRDFQGSITVDADPSSEYIAVVVQNVSVDDSGFRTAEKSQTLLMTESGTIIDRDFPQDWHNGKGYPLIQSSPVILPNTHLVFTEVYSPVSKQVSTHYWWTARNMGFGGSGSIGDPLWVFPPMFRNVPPSPALSPDKRYLLYLAREGDHIKVKLIKTRGVLMVTGPTLGGLKLMINGTSMNLWNSQIRYIGLPWGSYTVEVLNGSRVIYSTTISLKPDSYERIFVPSGRPVKEVKQNETSIALNGTKVEFNATTRIYRVEINNRPGYYVDHEVQITAVQGQPEALRMIFNVSKSVAYSVDDMILPPDTIIIQREPVIAFDIKDPREGNYTRGFAVITNATPEEVVKGIIVEHVLVTKSGEARVSGKASFGGAEVTTTSPSGEFNITSTSPLGETSSASKGGGGGSGSYILIGVATAVLLGAGLYLRGRK